MTQSELILNPDGSIYHLKLKPGELKKTIITVGDPERVRMISALLDEVYFTRVNREFVSCSGRIGNKELSIISTGIGTDNVDVVFNEIHALFNIDFDTLKPRERKVQLQFIRLGTSGAIQSDIELDTILLSEVALGYDGLLNFYEDHQNDSLPDELWNSQPELKKLPKPYFSQANADFLKTFGSVFHHSGITVTAPGFYAPQGRSVHLKPKIPDFIKLLAEVKFKEGGRITNLEMETAGIYGLSALLGHKAISVSAILANRMNGKFSKQPEKTVKNMINKTLELLSGQY